jgi:hypothetical protein
VLQQLVEFEGLMHKTRNCINVRLTNQVFMNVLRFKNHSHLASWAKEKRFRKLDEWKICNKNISRGLIIFKIVENVNFLRGMKIKAK